MADFTVKTYSVQQTDRAGNPIGPVLAIKLTWGAAHAIAKEYATAKVTPIIADKSPHPNNPEHPAFRSSCN